MDAEVFLDTNVLIYAAVGAKEDARKHKTAFGLLEARNFGLSAQVLAEFFTNVTRKPAKPLSFKEAARWVDRLCLFPVSSVDADLVRTAIVRSRDHRISYWDAAIIVAAENLGVRTVYSEDLNHDQSYGSVRVVNPFRDD